ncbi:DUF4270 family protein [Fulvivirgaceae bacterium BMA12]|uniref:DUF4270 family protein n=1 Tax=Agaribacillus aureus TaxID=3051825 RepID=A0ABT8L4A0_9BACT|nr:DUF4270 family protein [Fulvivirgaceae bacterium BMA12]
MFKENMRIDCLFLLIVVTAMTACTEEPNTIDSDFFNEESFEITFVDTLELITSTVQFDSLPTSHTGRLLFGYGEDEKLGKIKSTVFFNVGLDSTYELDQSISVYDSITLFLEFDGYYYYDTLQPQGYSLYGLKEELQFREETGLLYNTSYSELPPASYLEDSLLGSLSVRPRPSRDEGVEVRLSDEMGEALIQLAFEGSEIMSDASEFSEYFNGFVLVPDSLQSNSIVGFTPTSQLRLYYQDKSSIPSQQKYLEFSIGTKPYFSQITYDRTNTKLGELITLEEELDSDVTDNELYIQSGVGLGLKVMIPNIKDLIFSSDDFFISSAILTLRPVNNSFDGGTPLPRDVITYIIDEDNEILGSLEQQLLFQEDLELGRDTKYEANVVSFIKSQIQIDEFNENALLLTPPDSIFRSTVDRVYMGDPESSYQMELRVLYISLIED